MFPRPLTIARDLPAASPPAVSAIVTLFNYAGYVEECLESLAKQTQSGIELVVVDDKSTDAGLSVVLGWLDRNKGAFAGARILQHTTNMGLSYARNTAFFHAGADRVFVMDADNTLYPRAIERCMQAMTDAGSAGAYTQLEFFGDRPGLGDADFWSKERFKPKNYIDAMALVSKEAWRQVGGYDQLVANGWEDYDFWCKFVEHDLACTFVPEVLCRYRTHPASMSNTETNPNAGALILQMSIRHPWLDLQ
ncbi:MAG: glycosyltransferase family 2 protein [Alphaproteobacteria bacterium]|nr:glycosyltransferase family 2 protein [Alphaproteobacteria bacterium]